MGVFTEVTLEDAAALAAQYDLGELEELRGIPAGSVNSNFALTTRKGRVFLRVYEEQEASGARAEAALLTALAARGVRTPAPLVPPAGEAIGSLHGKPAAIFPWREGGMRCQASVSSADAHRLGAELARVHVAGAGLQAPEGRFNVGDLFARIDRIGAAADRSLAFEAGGLETHLRACVARREALGELPAGLIHGDLFRDNVLWTTNDGSEGEIAALLDFESASRGVLAFDLMVTLLAWCFGEGFDLALARALVAGYQTVRPLEAREVQALTVEGELAALRFTITRITDFAMKQGGQPRIMKDWRRFTRRREALEALGAEGLTKALGL